MSIQQTKSPPSLPSRRFGRRELNRAEARVAILRAAMELAAEEGLDEIPVEEIAERAGVSRMTFFNRFPGKDGLWLYFAWAWWLDNTIDIRSNALRGVAALFRLFERIAEADVRHRRFFQGFIAFIARIHDVADALEDVRPGPAEKALLRPDVVGVHEFEIVPMHVQLRLHLDEAREDGEISEDADLDALVIDLASAMYGEFLMAVVAGSGVLWPRYERQLVRILSYEGAWKRA